MKQRLNNFFCIAVYANSNKNTSSLQVCSATVMSATNSKRIGGDRFQMFHFMLLYFTTHARTVNSNAD